MCSVAPFLLPGLAGVAPRAAPFLHARSTVAPTYAYEGAPPARREYGYDAGADMDALLRDAHVAVRPRTPAAADDQPMSSAEFLGLSRPDHHNDADFDLEAVLRGIRSIRIVPAARFAPVNVAPVVSTPTTPVASLPAPRSYGSDNDEPVTDCGAATTNVQKQKPSEKQPDQGETYDAGIDATYHAMEKDSMERPSTDYLETTQQGQMLMADRAGLVAWMHTFAESYGLAPGALHRAVSYVDRFLSARKMIHGGDHVLGAAAVFAAAKYEDRSTMDVLDANAVARYARCARRDVVDAERELVAVLGYRLSGPTVYTFVEHFTRHIGEEDDDGVATRSLAHRLANLALLDYRCVGILPSVVAASAIVVAKLTLNPAAAWREELTAMGYAVEDLVECMEAIKEMHGLQGVWPGCAQMMEDSCSASQLRPCCIESLT